MKKRLNIKKWIWVIVVLAIIEAFIILNNSNNSNPENTGQSPVLSDMKLPENFEMQIFASGFQGIRFMEFYNGILFASVPGKGIVVAFPDKNNDGKADEAVKVIDGLNNPHGIAFLGDYMYVANEDSVIKVKLRDDLSADISTKEKLADLPEGGHWTRTIRIKGNDFYVSIGSSCNICIEKDERRASIMKCGLDSLKCEIYAKGSRNAVGFAFHPQTGEMFATENSRDWLGDDLPPDEINIIKEGRHYGWPFCYGKNVPDPEFEEENCSSKEPSFIDLQAHSAPLGLAFNTGSNFPQEYKNNLFVAYHGSWNRKVPTGYKVARIDIDAKKVYDFADGWLANGNDVLGRPVDLIFDKNGLMYASDDFSGVIYRISYKK